MESKPELIKDFYDFFEKNMWVADFEPCYDCPHLLEDLIPEEKKPSFITLGMNKSHSVFAIWTIIKATKIEDQPIVWIDSEGSPYEVFASGFKELLALIPYDTVSLYNYISAWNQYLDDPNNYQHLLKKYNNPSLFKEQLAHAASTHHPHQAYMKWIDARQIILSENPFMDIGKAMQAYPRLSQWLLSS